MSDLGKPVAERGGFEKLPDQLRDSLSYDFNKPDFRELDLGSPVSPLRTRQSGLTMTTTTSSSSSSSGSVSGRNGSIVTGRRYESRINNNSGELSGSNETSPTVSTRILKPGQIRSEPNIPVSSPSVNVLPTGNICSSGKILKTGMVVNRSSRSDVLGSRSGNYGHGSIMRGSGMGIRHSTASKGGTFDHNNTMGKAMEPDEVKRIGNEMYEKGQFLEALGLYDKAIALSPGIAAYRSNRAAALTALGRLGEAVKECEEAVKLDPNYWRAHQRLASLFLRVGQVENARKHLCLLEQPQDQTELQKLQAVEKHLCKCTDARRIRDWKSALRETDAAIATGADFSPQLFMCRVEALLKLHQLDDAESSLSVVPKLEPCTNSCSQTKFFGMFSEAYLFFVQAQIEMALGRFENAVIAAEKAEQIDPRNVEVAVLLNNVKLVARARARGNDLFKSERFTEACSAYGDGLRHDPSNTILYCNRAACWFKLGRWEHSVEDCDQALSIQPNYIKALLRRAASNSKLERWADVVQDYEVLRRELPDDNKIAESLFQAQVALKKSHGDFGKEACSIKQFRAAISLPGVSVVHFKMSCHMQCKQISPFVDSLCDRHPSVNFLNVDVEESPGVANAENIRILPTFKIYKNGCCLKEMVCPSREMLEHSVIHYSSYNP
ncbi:hypothetical protein ES319_A08G253500v1 [Gossypium barbadense]|uniref:Thioredoxin domain-containing protein n=2 Tax=Gossypium TaxID=3633 RepID=A0A5J5UWS1_GOSBA|nr:hypothetical protein ES319_A08G253500v1 [Gossypium barbadense]TYH07986.1 hypothetical protein ES288_A08G279300v1 [Gossypium darwinii]TYH07987.1 hypothetical protein ES288_A08G279300v1 [Gossypium darwinii]